MCEQQLCTILTRSESTVSIFRGSRNENSKPATEDGRKNLAALVQHPI